MRNRLPPLGRMIAAAVLAAGAALAHAETPAAEAARQAVATPTRSVEEADARLAQVAAGREAVDDEYAASEQVCYKKFFVNNCLDKAKEKRRVASAHWRAIEVEAEHFKRAESVRKRDADLAERAAKDAEELARREAAPHKAPKDPDAAPPRAAPKGPRVAERVATNTAKNQREEAASAAGAEQRAAKVAAFERKQADALRRQQEVTQKVAESRRKAAAKLADDKKKADAAAAAAAAAAAKK